MSWPLDTAETLAFETVAELKAYLGRFRLNPEDQAYIDCHAPRYLVALQVVGQCLARRQRSGEEAPILLDVAPHLLTQIFAAAFPVVVNTVGAEFRLEPPHPRRGQHLDYDLNQAHRHQGWRGFVRHDVVFMGEILEHLHASPRMVLGCASRWVKEGGFLVIQTPNAAALERRLTLLAGRNPYDMIREGDNPAHFREYTASELEEMGRYWQLETEEVSYHNHFRRAHWGRLRGILYELATWRPRTFRDGLTLVLRKPPGVPDPTAPSRLVRGHVEFLEVSAGQVTVAGWAVDTGARQPCALVDLVFDGQTFGGVSPSYDRPDVVTGLGGEKGYRRCGFHLTCPHPSGFDPDRLQVRTWDHYGDVLDLPTLPPGSSPGE